MVSPVVLRARESAFARAIAATIAVVVAGGIPGERLRRAHGDGLAPKPLVDAQVGGRDGAVDVTVRDAAGGAAVAGSHVRALLVLDDLPYVAEVADTDGTGHAHLARLPHGVLWIVADAPGHARGSSRVVVDSEPRPVAIDLGPEHMIEVAVREEGAAAIAGAEVEVVGPGDPLPVGARTGEDGIARVGRLGAGSWRVTARATGYDEASGRAARDGEKVAITLHKLGSLSVHVVGAGGVAASGARVSVAGATLWPARAAETNDRGDVRIGGLMAGVYALRASRGDQVSAIELGVTLDRGEEKALALTLAPGRWVGVRVTDGDSDDATAIAGARVLVAEGGLSPFPIEAVTDGNGHARLGPIAAGESTLSARAGGFVPRGAILVSDPPPTETRVSLVRAGTFAGRVVDERGYPIDGASIQIVGTDPSGAPIFDDPRRASFQAAQFDAMLGGPAPLVAAGELGVMPGMVPPIPPSLPFSGRQTSLLAPGVEPWVTHADGTFRASPASPGRLRAFVRHPQYVEAQSELVALNPGGEVEVTIVMHAGGALEGRVVDARNRPVEGARVSVSATRGTLERTTRAGSDGTFAFAALPDSVTLTAGTEDEEQPAVRMALEIPEGARKDVTVRLPEPRGTLAVTVVDDHDWPIGAAQVSASSLSADAPLRTTSFTDIHGEAALKRASGLPLRIEATAPGHAPRVVTADGTDDALRIVLAPAEKIVGEVAAASGGDAIPGADVTLYTEVGVHRARSDARGAFTLTELAPGSANLRVRARGFAVASRPLTIPDSAGQRSFAIPRIELAGEGVIEGDVVDARGDPVAGARVARDHAPTWLVVGASPDGVAVTDAQGRFSVGELPEGIVALEAYAPDLGRGRVDGVKVMSDRTTHNVRIALTKPIEPAERDRGATAMGSIALTLGETGAPVQVVIVSVGAASEAEHAGLAPGDVLLSVNDAPVRAIEDARERLSGPLSDDVVVRVKRGDGVLAMRIAREAVRR